MKYLVLIVVLLGFACGSEEEEMSLQDLGDFEDFSSAKQLGTLDPNLIIGNLVAALNSLNGTDLTTLINSVLGIGGTTAGLGALIAPIAGAKSVLALIVGAISGIIMVPVSIATQILALVGLVLLIIFLIEGGDLGTLVSGIGRSSSAWPSFEFPNFDLVNNPIVEGVSQMVFSALEKYD